MAFDIDAVTCAKAGQLAAYGMADHAIAGALMLSMEQVEWIKNTDEFRRSQAKALDERTERAIVLEQGWDSLEERALGQIHGMLDRMVDPKFALMAASIANRAQRRTPAPNNRVIDPNRSGQVIILTLGKNYAEKRAAQGGTIIDGNTTERPELAMKSHDIPPPAQVTQILGISDKRNLSPKEEYAHLLEMNGVTLDDFEDDDGT